MSKYIIEITLMDDVFEQSVPFPSEENLDMLLEVVEDALAPHDGVVDITGYEGSLMSAAIRQDVEEHFGDSFPKNEIDKIVSYIENSEWLWEKYFEIMRESIEEEDYSQSPIDEGDKE